MRVLVCPLAVIETPVEIVLKLLEPQNLGRWIDGKVESVQPEGRMVVGQEAILSKKALGLTWRAKIKVVGIDEINHEIRYDVFLSEGNPIQSFLGMRVEEKLQYAPLTDTTCEVHYNCNIIFQDGIRGWLIKTILGRAMIAGPADSLRSLKAEAEREYKQLHG
jgi:hypothetical protein